MEEQSRVAIVILNWNGKTFLETYLPSVTATRYANLEIIVADNASTDDSLQFLADHYPSIRVILLQRNYGFARGYNEALQQVTADYYMLLNSDVEVEAGWIDSMVQLMDGNTRIGACQPKILQIADRSLFEYAGAAGGWIDKYGYPFARGRIFDTVEKDSGQYDRSEPIFWASGAALFIRAPLYHEAGGFDNFFFAHQEEIDLCWRLQLLGYEIYSCPSAVVYHVGGGTLPQGNPRKTYLNFRNNHIMLYKNLRFGQKLWVLPIRFGLDWLSGVKGLLSGHPDYFFAIMRAHFAALSWWLSHRRESVYPASKSKKLLGRFRGNMVWEYYIRKRTKFQEIINS